MLNWIYLFLANCRGFFFQDPQESPDYGRIINDRHFKWVTCHSTMGRLSKRSAILVPMLLRPHIAKWRETWDRTLSLSFLVRSNWETGAIERHSRAENGEEGRRRLSPFSAARPSSSLTPVSLAFSNLGRSSLSITKRKQRDCVQRHLLVYLFVSEFVLAFLPSRLKPLLSCGTCVIVREAFACLFVCLSVCFWVRLGIPSQPAEAPAYWAAERVLLFARRLLVYLFVYLFVSEFVLAFLPSRLKPRLTELRNVCYCSRGVCLFICLFICLFLSSSWHSFPAGWSPGLLSCGTCVIVREAFACLFVCLSVCLWVRLGIPSQPAEAFTELRNVCYCSRGVCLFICLFICLFMSSSWDSFPAGWSLYWAAERVLLFARRLLVYLFVYLFVYEFVLAFLPSRLKPRLTELRNVCYCSRGVCLFVCLFICLFMCSSWDSFPAGWSRYWAAERVLLFARRLLVICLFICLFISSSVHSFLAGWSLYWATERVLLFARRLLVYLFVYLFVNMCSSVHSFPAGWSLYWAAERVCLVEHTTVATGSSRPRFSPASNQTIRLWTLRFVRHRGNMYMTSLPLVSGNMYWTSLPLVSGNMYLTSLPLVSGNMYLTSLPLVSGNIYLTSLPLVSGNMYLTSLPLVSGNIYLTSLPLVSGNMYWRHLRWSAFVASESWYKLI